MPPRELRTNSMTRNTAYRAKLKREYQEQVWCAGNERLPGIDGKCIARPGRHVWKAEAPHSTALYLAPVLPWKKAQVEYVWRSTHETDVDNIIASMKPALDVLKATGPRPLGIIADDGPGIEVSARWEKVSRRSEEAVVITIRQIA